MHRIVLLLLVTLSFPGSVIAGEPKTAKASGGSEAEGLAFYEEKVKPILAQHCYRCHSHAAKKNKGGLVVDSLAAMLTGGDTGPAVVPGKPDQSLLIQAVRFNDEDLRMPPEQKLADEEIAILTDWVQQGAPAPQGPAVEPRGKFTDADRAWWAFQPLTHPPVPQPKNPSWARTEIDRFILDRLEKEGLQPSPEADQRTLIRRLYFDVIGLPPSTAEIEAFLSDSSPNAYEKLVDKLLASPHYGERWARHWLDLVRYAESDGYRLDEYRPTAWRYRDYVIRSLNNDKPYDRFVQEQIAGDELFPDDPDALIATGYLRHTIYEYNQRDVMTQWADILNDLTDTTGEVFLGLGFSCARCHDHKFDPILQKDYYRLQAFFAPFLPIDDVVFATRKEKEEHARQLAAWEEATKEIRRKIDLLEEPYKKRAAKGAIGKFIDEIQAMIDKPVEQRTAYEHQIAELAYRQVLYEYGRLEKSMKDEDKQALAALKRELASFDHLKPAPLPTGLAVTDAKPVAPPVRIPKKGDQSLIEPGILSILDEKPMEIPPPPAGPGTTGRRAALARWLTRPDNPLTTRVIVNRLWQYHFGRGIVATSSDFGRLGEKPSHPELLDWLANRFVQDGWSFKALHRLILTSSVYRQSAVAPAAPEALRKDPENRLLWRFTTRRLDAEQIRDAILFATGELDLTPGGPAVDFTTPRRTIYTRHMRNTRDGLLDVFDLPEGFTSTPQRNVTTTPTQALLLFNAQSFIQRAKAMASRLTQEAPTDEERVTRAYQLAYGRDPRPQELAEAIRFLQEQTRRIDPKTGGKAGFYSEKMPYREGRAALLTPNGAQNRLLVSQLKDFPGESFTVEAFILLRSLYDSGRVRVIASQWSGSTKAMDKAGWSFGVTSLKSAYKPQTLVLQLWDGQGGYEPIFSGLHIALNKPYFVAVTVNLKDTSEKGIVFYAKDLSNDDEPMLSAEVSHRLQGMKKPVAPMAIGGFASDEAPSWDGLIDDVRVSKVALRNEQLLLTSEGVQDHTVGLWPFESRPHPYHDATGHGFNIQTDGAVENRPAPPSLAALIDFCHVLLNSNEFLYVD